MKPIFGIALAGLLCASNAQGALPEVPANPEQAAEWKARRMATIREMESAPRETAIAGLSEVVRNLAGLRYRDCPERTEVLESARSKLLSIPGYAEYYRDKVLAARLELDAHPENRGPLKGELMDAQMEGFGTLAHLPSVETVRVLGAFLADERGLTIIPDGKEPSEREIQEARAETPNCTAAARALTNLPLVGKPVAGNRIIRYTDVEPWRQWYERVKSGNATFRFEGDPTEYDLDGPAPPEKLKRLSLARQRDARRAAGNQGGAGAADAGGDSPSASATPALSLTAILLAAGVLCLASVWYFLRRRAVVLAGRHLGRRIS